MRKAKSNDEKSPRTINIDRDLHKKLKYVALDTEKSIKQLIEEAVVKTYIKPSVN